ncbi:Pol protein [Phytophthora palmivora]|uniref:Pol protein n=1 Tax=Phytophthora palmivora TaxID=4796 RepID=A0A2P4X235_9STRA|nr:Pol protein [Phytophthora palmivora]
MKPAKLNYPVREQGLPFNVKTDRKSIEMILTQKTTNRRIARWFNELAEFQLLFKWIPGETNTVADALSRKKDFEHKAAQVSLKELLEAAQNREIVATVVATKMTVAQSAKQMYSRKKVLLWLVKSLNDDKKIPRYSIDDGVLYYQTGEDEVLRLYIPDDEDLKNRIICENHDSVSAEHPGFYKTYLAVLQKYYWPKMMKYIQRYVNTCEMCQRNKARQTKPPGLLQSLDVPRGRRVDISMDFIISLPETENGYNAA